MFVKNRFGTLSLLFAVLVIVSTLIRTVLLLKALPFIEISLPLLVREYGVGLFYDCVTFLYFVIPFALYLILIPDKVYTSSYHKVVVYAVSFIVTYVLLFDAVAEYFFFEEFGTRFNFIAIDYLVYTREVVGNIKESYHLTPILILLFVFAGAIVFSLSKHIDRSLKTTSTIRQRLAAGLIFAAAPILVFAFVNQSFTNITQNAYANEIAGNGIYDLFAAFRNNELDYNKFYPTKDDDFVLARLRGILQEKSTRFANSDIRDITRHVSGRGAEKKLNVIVLVEESLSAEYLGVFGNTHGLTPNLDRLAGESLFFTQLYATGTRTVRGLEAITLAMPPLPGISVIKRPGNEGFFSWGSVMREKGYDTRFIYAGHGYFDNMNYFFSRNGFDAVDRNDFSKDEISFSNAWGVCDEDLFKKVITEAGKSHALGRPFFSIVMTTSNHRPYTYPSGKIDIPSGTGRDGAVKYADYAVGRFIAEAKKRPWFADTIIVIVADHCASSAGKTALPVKNYEIPMLVYAPAHVRPRKIDVMASQIDIAPTILGLLNFNYTTKFMGRDVLGTERGPQRAFISTYQKLGFIKGERLVVISPQKRQQTYAFARRSGSMNEIPASEDIENDTLAYYQGLNYLYQNRLNRL